MSIIRRSIIAVSTHLTNGPNTVRNREKLERIRDKEQVSYADTLQLANTITGRVINDISELSRKETMKLYDAIKSIHKWKH